MISLILRFWIWSLIILFVIIIRIQFECIIHIPRSLTFIVIGKVIIIIRVLYFIISWRYIFNYCFLSWHRIIRWYSFFLFIQRRVYICLVYILLFFLWLILNLVWLFLKLLKFLHILRYLIFLFLWYKFVLIILFLLFT